MEKHDGKDIPVYRGDIINSYEASEAARTANPERIEQAYLLSSATLNYIRALTKGVSRISITHKTGIWTLYPRHLSAANMKKLFLVSKTPSSLWSPLGSKEDKLQSVEFYTSHEGLLLPMEESLTRYEPAYDAWYNLGAHMLWIGDRTRDLSGAHIEYFRGIANPIGLKVGPSADPKDIVEIIKALNPKNQLGKVTLISRFGAGEVNNHLPRFIDAVRDQGLEVLWSSDPMHGNAIKTEGTKTRNFDSILSEVSDSFKVHQKNNSHLAGIHFELTGEDVTECIGGTAGITEANLEQKYETFCDPRLNYSQSLEMAFLISDMISNRS